MGDRGETMEFGLRRDGQFISIASLSQGYNQIGEGGGKDRST